MNNESLKETTPEHWFCIDCSINTAPGMLTRVEFEAAFAADENDNGVELHINAQSEIYTVREAVWAAAGMEPQGGCLCIGCLEKRLSRLLRPKDFQRGHPLNTLPGTQRLLKRRGRHHRDSFKASRG